MSSTVIKGNITFTDGRVVEWVAGPRERIKAERILKVRPSDLRDGNAGEEYFAFLIFEAVKREGELANVTFDQFIEDYLADYDVSSDPE